MQGSIKLEFSPDGGTTWYGATDFGASSDNIACSAVHAWLEYEPQEDSEPQSMTDDELCFKGVARLVVSVEIATGVCDVTTADGRAFYKFIGSLRCAPLIRMYDNGYTGGIDGYDKWSLDPNANYLGPGDVPDPTFPSAGEKNASYDFTLRSKKSTDIAP